MPSHRAVLSIFITICLAGLAACGGAKESSATSLDAELPAIATAVAAAAGYPADAIEVTGSRIRLRLAINATNLATADQSTRESAARSVVVAAEQAMAACQPCAAIESLSVAIVHSAPKDSPGAWHIEDVVEFRRGSDGKFAPHTT